MIFEKCWKMAKKRRTRIDFKAFLKKGNITLLPINLGKILKYKDFRNFDKNIIRMIKNFI